jgi:hypothetical protein
VQIFDFAVRVSAVVKALPDTLFAKRSRRTQRPKSKIRNRNSEIN